MSRAATSILVFGVSSSWPSASTTAQPCAKM